jgi:hypothetical protein
MSPAGHGDNNATFLAEFRALRDRAGLDHAELAARAHYPSDLLKEAEAGPGLPGLPVLAAYVRACAADVTEWEERWRRLAAAEPAGEPAGEPGPEAAREDGGLPVRPAGASPAAQAGARAGVTVAPADVHDPDRIRAALRAHRAREDKATSHSPPGNGNGGAATMLANGHHHRPSAVAHASTAAWYASSSPDSAETSAGFSGFSGASGASGVSATAATPAGVNEPEFAAAESAAVSAPVTADHSPTPRVTDHFAVPSASDLTTGNPSSAGHVSPDSHHASPDPRTGASVTAARGRQSHGRGQLKLVGLVLVVLIGCIVLLTIL